MATVHPTAAVERAKPRLPRHPLSLPRPPGVPTRGPKQETPALPSRSLRIVALGGGTGLSAVLKGLKAYAAPSGEHRTNDPVVDVTAVVTVSDDGGSSGRLRRAFDMLAPGDIRNCMVALAEDETLLSRLFQYRFPNAKGLDGHSFGNLFLTALTEVTGDFHQAIQLSSAVLAIRGRIFPSTLENVRLQAELETGRRVQGETRISRVADKIRKIRLRPRRCAPVPETLAAIAEADLITLGPGSLYTSIIPNLLVEGIPEAIARSGAPIAYISNLMSQPGETDGYAASDHVSAIHEHAGSALLSVAILSASPISAAARKRYAAEGARPVKRDVLKLMKLGVRVIEEDLAASGPSVRHDSARLAQLLVRLARRARVRSVGRE